MKGSEALHTQIISLGMSVTRILTSLKGLLPSLHMFTLSRMEQDG